MDIRTIKSSLAAENDYESQLKFTGNRSITILNKSGRFIVSGKYKGERFKIFECHNEHHAFFSNQVFSSESLKSYFPETTLFEGCFLISKWINGMIASEATNKKFNLFSKLSDVAVVEKIAVIQSIIHNEVASAFDEPRFCYINDYILPRFKRVADLFGQYKCYEKIRSVLTEDTSKNYIIHPDVSLSNIIIDCNKNLFIIDNELMSKSNSFIYDLCNTTFNMQNKDKNFYIESYLSLTRAQADRYLVDLAKAFWAARLSGSLFICGKLKLARQIITDYSKMRLQLPFDENIIRFS